MGESGLCLPPITQSNTTAKIDYDYFIKDHLGNVRSVITSETQQDIYPMVSLEDGPSGNTSAARHLEAQYYNIDPGKVVLNSQAQGVDLSPNTPYPNNN